MDELQIRGLAIMLAIALGVMLIFLRGQKRPIWWFALALVAVGLGYLATTQAPRDLAIAILGPPEAPAATAPAEIEPKPAPAQ